MRRSPGKVVLVAGLVLLLLAGRDRRSPRRSTTRGLPRGPYPRSAAAPSSPRPTRAPPTRRRPPTSRPGTRTSPQAPVDPNSARDHRLHQLPRRRLPAPRLRLAARVRLPLRGRRQATRSGTKVNFTAYGDESDHGAYRVPLNAPVEGGPRLGRRPPRDRRRPLALHALRALPRLPAQRSRSRTGTPTSA